MYGRCTALPTAALIAGIEAACEIPVVTSNQATLWECLCRLGIGERVSGFGRLLEAH